MGITELLFVLGMTHGTLTRREIVKDLIEMGITEDTIIRMINCLKEIRQAAYQNDQIYKKGNRHYLKPDTCSHASREFPCSFCEEEK